MSLPDSEYATPSKNNTSSISLPSSNFESENTGASISAPAYDVRVDDLETKGSTALPSTKSKNNDAEEKGSWKLPFELGEAMTLGQVLKSIYSLTVNGKEVVNVISNSEDIAGDLGKIEYDLEALSEVAGYLSGKYSMDDEISANDAEMLNGFSSDFENSYGPGVDAITNASEKKVGLVKNFKTINTKDPKIKQALNVAFLNNENSSLKDLNTMIETAETYNSKGLEAIEYSKYVSSSLKDSKLILNIDKGGKKLEGFLSKVKEVVDVAYHFSNVFTESSSGDITDVASKLESMMELVDKSINLVDLPGLNVLQGMWNYVYKPMVDVCVKGVGEIADKRASQFRDITEIRIGPNWNKIKPGPDNTAPTQVKSDLNEFFSKSGGWEVFKWLWDIMVGKNAEPNGEVVKFFEDNYNSINSATKTDIPYDGIWPMWNIDPEDLMYWSKYEKHTLWSMFYGTNLPFPPGT